MFAALASKTWGIKAMGIAVLVCVLLAGALALTGRAYLAEIGRHGETKAQLQAEKTARAEDQLQARSVNASNQLAILQLQQSLAAFRLDADRRTLENEAALARERTRSTSLQRMLDAERRARAAIYAADPDAKAWAEAVVPAAIEAQLRASFRQTEVSQ
jgi:hypothetical protein